MYKFLYEHLYSQLDEEGNKYRLFKSLIGHMKKISAVDKVDGYRLVNGKRINKKTTTR